MGLIVPTFSVRPLLYLHEDVTAGVLRVYHSKIKQEVLHPSETHERMMARVLAYCINAEEHLSFTKGLSSTEEPALWVKSLDGQISSWIDVGEPSLERIKKATRISQVVKVYTFNTKSELWWSRISAAVNPLPVSVFRFQYASLQALTAMLQRTMAFSVTISEESAFIATAMGECEVNWLAC